MLKSLNISQLAQKVQTACLAEAGAVRQLAAVRQPLHQRAAANKREPKSFEPTRKSARQGGREPGSEDASNAATGPKESFAELDEHAGECYTATCHSTRNLA